MSFAPHAVAAWLFAIGLWGGLEHASGPDRAQPHSSAVLYPLVLLAIGYRSGAKAASRATRCSSAWRCCTRARER